MRNLFIFTAAHIGWPRSILHAWLARRKRAVGWECSQEDGYWFAAHLMATLYAAAVSVCGCGQTAGG
jgi:hypothetical protein